MNSCKLPEVFLGLILSEGELLFDFKVFVLLKRLVYEYVCLKSDLTFVSFHLYREK